MKIKRYQANDIRSAIKIVRNELGEDAVILSNQRVGNQTEVIAAIDYDESLFNDSTNTVVPSNSRDSDNVIDSYEDKDRSHFYDDLKYTRNLQQNKYSDDAVVDDDKIILPEQAEKDLILKIEKELVAKLEKGLLNKIDLESKKIDFEKNQLKIAGKSVKTKNLSSQEAPAMTDMKKQINELRSLLITQFTEKNTETEVTKNPLRSVILKRLIAFGLSSSLANEIADYTDTKKDFDHNWHHALALISHRVTVKNDDILSQGGVVALIGATGVGKTTTVAKLAAQFILRHGKDSVALISTDNYRIAAHEQLRTFSRILNVPMYVATDVKQLKSILNVVNDKKLVLIDTAGMTPQDLAICSQFKSIRKNNPIKTYLVYAVNSQRTVLEDVLRTCKNIKIEACIYTKLDETTNLGGAISVCIESNIPVAYFSDGQRVPENLHVAFAHSLVSKNVAMMQCSRENRAKFKSSMSVQGLVSHAHG